MNFLKETWTRIKSKSPSYFRIIQAVSGITAIITGIPTILANYGVILPDLFKGMVNKVVAIAAIVGYVISKLPVKDPNVLK